MNFCAVPDENDPGNLSIPAYTEDSDMEESIDDEDFNIHSIPEDDIAVISFQPDADTLESGCDNPPDATEEMDDEMEDAIWEEAEDLLYFGGPVEEDADDFVNESGADSNGEDEE